MAAEPITGKEVLTNNHSKSNYDGIGNTYKAITAKTIAAEDEAADDGLEQVVGKTHTPEDTEMMKHSTNALESIPSRDDGRDNH